MGRLLNDAGWIFAFRLVNLPLQFLLFALAARYLTLAEVGGYAVFYAAWALVRAFGPLGLDQASSRFVPAYLNEKRDRAARYFEKTTRTAVLGWSAVAAIVVGTIAMLAIRWEWLDTRGVYVMYGMLAAPAYALVPLFSAQLRARGRPRAAQFPDSVILPGVVIVILQAEQVIGGATLGGLLLAQAAAVWLTVALYAAFDASTPSGESGSAFIEWGPVRGMAVAVFFGVAANAVGVRLPVILITAVLGLEAAALYEAGQRFAFLATLATWSASAAVMPMMSAAFASGDRARLQYLLSVASWAAFLPALGALLVLLIGGKLLLSLFGPAYVEAYGTMLLLACFTTFNASAGLSSNALNMTGQERIVMMFNFIQLAVIAVGIPVLSARFGLEGAALAMLIGSIVRDGGMSLILPSRLGIAPGVWSLRGTQVAYRAGMSAFRRRRTGQADG